jgi:hypothetical protein
MGGSRAACLTVQFAYSESQADPSALSVIAPRQVASEAGFPDTYHGENYDGGPLLSSA